LRSLLVQRHVQRDQPPRGWRQRLVARDPRALCRVARLPRRAAAVVRVAGQGEAAGCLAASRRTRADARLAGAVCGVRRAQPGQAHRPALAAVVPAGAGAQRGACPRAAAAGRERADIRAARGAARDPDCRRRGTAAGNLAGHPVPRAPRISGPHRRTAGRDRTGPAEQGAGCRQLRLGGAPRLPRAPPGAGFRPRHLARAPGRHQQRLADLCRQGLSHPAPGTAAAAGLPTVLREHRGKENPTWKRLLSLRGRPQLQLRGLPRRRAGAGARSLLPHSVPAARGSLLFFRALFPAMSRVPGFLELLRPQQWIKNAFVLVGLVFGHAWRDPAMVNAVLLATLAFCLASGAVYAFNDARDAARDREHPDKRTRPVARGAVSPGEAHALSAVAAIVALALAAWVGWQAVAIVAAYLVLSAAYTVWLKHIPVLDVVAIAAGFMLRLL